MKRMDGFSALEVIIVLSVLIIFGAAAIPAYYDYERRIYFNNVIQITAPYKTAVEACYKKTKNFSNCSGGQNAIPANLSKTENFENLQTTKGAIVVTPLVIYGILKTDQYILTPSVEPKTKNVVWVNGGDATKKQYY